MDLQAFLGSLQAAKKELMRPERLGLTERAVFLRRVGECLLDPALRWRELDPYGSFFSEEFYSAQVLQASAHAFERAALQLDVPPSSFPTGVISLSLRSPFFLRLLCERLAPALAAGNVVLCKVDPREQDLLGEVRKALVLAGFNEDVLQTVNASDEVASFLLQHPGIRAVSAFDPDFNFEQISPTTIAQKKWQIHRGGKSTALVLADAELDQAVEGIHRSVREGFGSSSWNISRVIVTEAVEKEFTRRLVDKAAAVTLQLPAFIQEKKNQWLKDLVQQQARLISGDSSIAILQNISNCTEAHQQELSAPIVFLMSVKYAHEMQKWVNNLPNAVGVQIWGSPEKVQRLAEKIEAARLWNGRWLEADSDLFYGVKNSIFGDPDNRVFGSFFSERKNFDREPSNNRH